MPHMMIVYESASAPRIFDDLDTFVAACRRLRSGQAQIGYHRATGSSVWAGCTADTAAAVYADMADGEERDRLARRRPFLWAELLPAWMAAHMARRPAGYPRAEWAERLTDPALDRELTVDDLVKRLAADDPAGMAAHMARRPAHHPRPDWARRAVAEPPGGYDAWRRIVVGAGQ